VPEGCDDDRLLLLKESRVEFRVLGLHLLEARGDVGGEEEAQFVVVRGLLRISRHGARQRVGVESDERRRQGRREDGDG
jgi:hypothetical protein